MSSKNIIEMKNVVKKFGEFYANDHINLAIRKGEIHALLGENGAGKTTLMNILYGLYTPDEGEIHIEGQKVEIKEPSDAIKLGIGMVHQHFMLVPTFTVAENLILGVEPVKGIKLDMKTAISKILEVSEEYGLKVDPNVLVSNISVGMQQRVEILKVLLRGAKILIFDEPTGALTPQEIIEFFRICRTLQARGNTIIIITHKLKEIKQISDRVTVIRTGTNIDTVSTENVDEEKLAEMMVGRKVVLSVNKCEQSCGEIVLEMKDVHANSLRGTPALRGLSLNVKAGEIVGIAGVEGNGQLELAMALRKLINVTQGTIEFCGKEYSGKTTTQSLIDSGLTFIPEDRRKHGLVLQFSIKENLIMGVEDDAAFCKGWFLDDKKITAFGEKLREEYDIRCTDVNLAAGMLSGGNQQKVILAREISKDPKLMVVSQPTRGLDVGAIEYVHSQLLEQRKRGCAILLISYDLDEIISLSDRILAIYNGEIISEYCGDDVNSSVIGLAMTGIKKADAAQSNGGI
jgi:simple sugar transport system ATP-binding protein